MENLLTQILSASPDTKIQTLNDLSKHYISTKGKLAVSDSTKLFSALNTLLNDKDSEVICRSQFFLQLIITDFQGEPEFLVALVPTLVVQMGDKSSTNFRNSLNLIQILMSVVRNSSKVIESLIKAGLYSDKANIKEELLNVFPSVLSAAPVDSLKIPALRKLLKRSACLENDSNTNVANSAARCVKKLSGTYKELLGNSLLSRKKLQPVSEEYRALVYGFIPHRVFPAISDSDWNIRLGGLKSIYGVLQDLQSHAPLVPFKNEILSMVNQLLSDSSYAVLQLTFSFLEKVLEISEIAGAAVLEETLEICLRKLSDTRIAVRQSVFSIFKTFYKVVPPFLVYQQLRKFISHEKWMVRLEVLQIYMLGMLTFPKQYNYLAFTPDFASLLDDHSSKVRFTVTEALSLISCYYGHEAVTRELTPIVDEDALKTLQLRFKLNQVPTLKEKYIEYNKSMNMSAISTPYFSPRENFANPRNCSENNEKSVKKNKILISTERSLQRVRRIPKIPKIPIFEASKMNISASTPALCSPKSVENTTEVHYLSYAELEPLKSPDGAIELLSDRSDWKSAFASINIIRRLAKHHISSVNSAGFMDTAINHADSLRSALSKNGLILIGELCRVLGKQLDPKIGEILKTLMKKVADSSVFISSAARSSLESFSVNLTEAKVMSYLGEYIKSNSCCVRANACRCIRKIINKLGKGVLKFRPFQLIVKTLGDLIGDAAEKVRDEAKLSFISLKLAIAESFESVVHAILNGKLAKKVLASVENAQDLENLCQRRNTLPPIKPLEIGNKIQFRAGSVQQPTKEDSERPQLRLQLKLRALNLKSLRLEGLVNKQSKVLLSRQFVDITRPQIEGFLSSFTNLVDSSRQHTFVENESVRFIYQPIDSIYLVLVTTKDSNIVDDLETLRLLHKVVNHYCPFGLDEGLILKNSFDIILACDDVISFGHRESVTLSQLLTYADMESAEEKLYREKVRAQMQEAKEVAKLKRKELDKKRALEKKKSQETEEKTLGPTEPDLPPIPMPPAEIAGRATDPVVARGPVKKGMQLASRGKKTLPDDM